MPTIDTSNKKNSLLKSSYIVGSMTFISRISGFIRDIIFANIFGASSSTDAFFVAFKIPNFFRRLFAEGAFTQAFVPILNEFKIRRPDELKQFITYIQGNLMIVLLAVTIIGVVFSDIIVGIFAPGFTDTDNRFSLAANMLQITFPYLFFISLTALYAGIFNTYDKFLLPAITPVFLNISLITSALFLTSMFDEPIMALAYGVLIAGVLQYMIQLPAINNLNLLVLPKVSFKFDGVNKVLKLMAPAMLGTAVVQINLVIDSIVASLLAAGSISWLYYSDRLVEFPLGVFGIAIATVILPTLSSKFAENNLSSFKKTLKNALNIAVVFSLPAMLGLIILSQYIILSLFQYGNFSQEDTIMASLSLIAYSVGLPAFILMKVLLTGFFSRQDTKTPVIYGIYAITFNIIMNISVVIYYNYNQFVGAHSLLALATSLSAWIQVILLYNKLTKDKIIEENLFFNKINLKSFTSGFVMVFVLFSTLISIELWAQSPYYWRGIMLAGYIILGSLIYGLLMYLFGYRFSRNDL